MIGNKWDPRGILADPLTTTDRKVVLRTKYKREAEGQDVWKLPSQTVADGFGDCEDLSILALKIWLNRGMLVQNLEMQIGQVWTRRGRQWHAVAFLRAAHTYYDCRYRLHADRFRGELYGFEPMLVFRLNKEGAAFI